MGSDRHVAGQVRAHAGIWERAVGVGHRGDGRRRLSQDFGRQVFDVDHLAWGHHRDPMAEVFQLANVARKVKARNPFQGDG